MSNYKKILVTGGNGRFGKVFKKIFKSKKYLYPSKKKFNIEKIKMIKIGDNVKKSTECLINRNFGSKFGNKLFKSI